MATAPKTISSRPAQVLTEPTTAAATLLLEEALTPIQSATLPPEFRKLASFMPIVVLIPKSAVRHASASSASPGVRFANDSVTLAAKLPEEIRSSGFNSLLCPAKLEFGEVTVSLSAMEAWRNGEPVALTLKELQTLAYMFRNAGRVISREELLSEVWGYECYPCTRTVDNHILRLRQKLEVDPSRPRHFLTVHSAGYKFLC